MSKHEGTPVAPPDHLTQPTNESGQKKKTCPWCGEGQGNLPEHMRGRSCPEKPQ